ncbi:MAG: hypothetical protein HQK77_18305, partial [Desulfobacterales bacterium]|nr:hypothetical protein [Desulfobacterales bacterium]
MMPKSYDNFCDFLNRPCITKDCLFWQEGFKRTICCNITEIFAISLVHSLTLSQNKTLFASKQSMSLRHILTHVSPVYAWMALSYSDVLQLLNHLIDSNTSEHSPALVINLCRTLHIANRYNCIHQMKGTETLSETYTENNSTLKEYYQQINWWDFVDLQFMSLSDLKDLFISIDNETLVKALSNADDYTIEAVLNAFDSDRKRFIQEKLSDQQNIDHLLVHRAQERIIRDVISRAGSISLSHIQYPFKALFKNQPSTSPIMSSSKPLLSMKERLCPLLQNEQGCIQQECCYWNFSGILNQRDKGCVIVLILRLLYEKKYLNPKIESHQHLIDILLKGLIVLPRTFSTIIIKSLNASVVASLVTRLLDLYYHDRHRLSQIDYELLMAVIESESDESADTIKDRKLSQTEKDALFEYAADIMAYIHRDDRKIIQKEITKKCHGIDKKILHSMITYEQLIELDDLATREWLKKVEFKDILLALKLSSEEMKQKIVSNLTQRTAAMLEEDLAVMGPVRIA